MPFYKYFSLLISCLLLSIPLFAQNGIIAKDFFVSGDVRLASLSPNGSYLAMVYKTENGDQISIFDFTKNKSVNTFQLGRSKIVGEFYWADDERFLIREGIKKYGYFDFPVYDNTLLSSKVDGSQKRRLLGQPDGNSRQYHGFFINNILKNEPRKILISKYLDNGTQRTLHKLDLVSGRTKRVGASPIRRGYIYTDINGNERLVSGVAENGDELISYKSSVNSQWIDLPNPNDELSVRSLTDDGKIAYLYTTKDSDTDKLISLELSTGKFTDIHNDPRIDITFSVAENDGYISAVSTDFDYPAYKYLDKTKYKAQLLQALSKQFPNENVDISSLAEDNSKILFSTHSDSKPYTYYLYNLTTKKINIVAQSKNKYKDYAFKSMEHIAFKARDGKEIHAYLTKASTEPAPTIMLVHGGPHGPRDYWGFDSEVQYFVSHGFNVMQVNFRGSGGYGKDFEESGYKNWGTSMQDDLTDATKWAIKNGIADKDRICIYGASYGGYAALMGTIREPDLYQCAIGYVGVYDLPMMYGEGDIPESPEGKEYLLEVLGNDNSDLRKRSPVHNVDKIKADIFLIHGAKDERAHFEHYKRMTKALNKAGIKYKSLVKPGEGHGFSQDDNIIEAYEEMLAFFKKHTK